MSESDRFDELVRLTYEAALDAGKWPTFLRAFAEATSSPATGLVVQDLRNRNGSIAETFGFDPRWQRSYQEYYSALNIWTIRGAHLFQAGAVTTGQQAINDSDLERTEFYSDWLRPQDWFYSYGGIIHRHEALTSYVTAMRSKNDGPFEKAEFELLRRLMPHLQTALRVHDRIAGLEGQLSAATDALDHFQQGVLVCDKDSRVLYANQSAKSRINARSGLFVDRDGIRVDSLRDTNRLRAAIQDASSTGRAKQPEKCSVLSIMRPDGLYPLEILVVPVPPGNSVAQKGPGAVLFITDPSIKTRPDTDVLRQVHGLTPAEARLAGALLTGTTVERFAEENQISVNTARTHLKKLFLKLDVTRQGELIRVLLTSTAMLITRHER